MRINHPLFFFSELEKKKIISAIKEAEQNTSGEIRVHLERHVRRDILEHAQKVFEKIGMTRTKDRNGVLIFLATQDKRFVILGDKGIHEKVPADFWDDSAKLMGDYFKKGDFAEGIAQAVLRAGEKLSTYFPCRADDVNELPNHISL